MKITLAVLALFAAYAVALPAPVVDINTRDADALPDDTPPTTDTVSFIPCTRAFCGGGYIKRDLEVPSAE